MISLFRRGRAVFINRLSGDSGGGSHVGLQWGFNYGVSCSELCRQLEDRRVPQLRCFDSLGSFIDHSQRSMDF